MNIGVCEAQLKQLLTPKHESKAFPRFLNNYTYRTISYTQKWVSPIFKKLQIKSIRKLNGLAVTLW